MHIFKNDLIGDQFLFRLKAATRKQAFQQIAEQAALQTALDASALYRELAAQELISASATGNGVAIPQARPAQLARPLLIFATLAQPVDFNAFDSKPVDLIAAVFSPPKDGPLHLQRLAGVSRLMRDETLQQSLREADSEDTLHALLNGSLPYSLAA